MIAARGSEENVKAFDLGINHHSGLHSVVYSAGIVWTLPRELKTATTAPFLKLASKLSFSR